LRWRQERELERLMGDPDYHDPRIAGWWIWGISCWIGGGWCDGSGPWIVDADGRITRRAGGEPGVSKKLPHLTGNGQGVNTQTAREPGVSRQLPHLTGNGQGVNTQTAREPGVGDFHPMTMPEVRRWFAFLSARLRHVRILNGDWARAVTTGASKTLSVRTGGVAGVFLDPPYSAEAGWCGSIYAVEDLSVAHAVRAWCLAHGEDPQYRIVLAGFDTEHTELESHGWRVTEWFKAGFLKGGMAQQGKGGHQQHRERLWLSPHCLGATADRQMGLFGEAAAHG
jgi:hypothetical protein